ncbi:MAG: response regulator [Parvularcula sp.]|jgi:CheY-like chemotaxis protein|nr:response regulator [Parvularcula sp.]
MTRPPLGVVRQFSRAVFADRLIGDELMRMTMARVSIDPASSSSSVVDVMSAFLHSWRLAMKERPQKPVLFSDAALIDALPPPPDDTRLMLLMVDVMGLQPAQAARVIGLQEDNPAAVLQRARLGLRIEKAARAVVIEDEPLIAADIRGILERLGVEVAGEASSAAEAVRVARDEKPDIILADYNLDGRETGIDAVLGINEVHDCPVIFITGFPDRVLQGDEIEPDFVISKPYTPENVRAAVVHCLDARRG